MILGILLEKLGGDTGFRVMGLPWAFAMVFI
jgi:hypothetical protein